MIKKIGIAMGIGVLVLAGIGLILYSTLTGPEDLSAFPPRETSPYVLPWAKGASKLCVQGVRGIVSHRGNSQFAYDFYMSVGTDILAAREGMVTRVVQHHDGNGVNWPNNVVVVEHEDGTRACYAHIRKGGALVAEGQAVAQGEAIALSGNVGNSMMPHLHFHVTDPAQGKTIPITFRDVHRDLGIPRMFHWYVSGEEKGQGSKVEE